MVRKPDGDDRYRAHPDCGPHKHKQIGRLPHPEKMQSDDKSYGRQDVSWESKTPEKPHDGSDAGQFEGDSSAVDTAAERAGHRSRVRHQAPDEEGRRNRDAKREAPRAPRAR